MANLYGIDFGTTNSLVSIIEDNKVLSLLQNEAPHPSIVICRGDDMTTGQIAKEQADATMLWMMGLYEVQKYFLVAIIIFIQFLEEKTSPEKI